MSYCRANVVGGMLPKIRGWIFKTSVNKLLKGCWPLFKSDLVTVLVKTKNQTHFVSQRCHDYRIVSGWRAGVNAVHHGKTHSHLLLMDSTLLEMRYLREAALYSLETNAFGESMVRVEHYRTVRRNGLVGRYIDVDVFLTHYWGTRRPNKPVGWILNQTADVIQMRRAEFLGTTVYKSSSVQLQAWGGE